MDESRQWVEFGRWLGEQREERGLRRREAAKRAQIPEAMWRDLETGRKEAVGGIRLLPNPSEDVLSRVADVLEVPLKDVLDRIGRHSAPALRAVTAVTQSSIGTADGGPIVAKIRRLNARDRALVEHLVDQMLALED
ncbi:MAG: helix-turn-helix domain-containing protein [Acidimicrobiales bacterium]